MASPPSTLLEGGDVRVLNKVREVVAIIAEKSSAERWEAVARLRLFCEGASSAEELEEIGSKKVPTMRTLVELLDEVSSTLGGDTPEAQVLDDVVWVLVRAATRRRTLAVAHRPQSGMHPSPPCALAELLTIHIPVRALRDAARRNACSAA